MRRVTYHGPAVYCVVDNHVFISIYNLCIIMALVTLAIFLLERSLLVTDFITNEARLFVICTLENRAYCLIVWRISRIITIIIYLCVSLYTCYFVVVVVDTVLFENLHFSLGLQMTFLHFSIFVILDSR